MKEVLGMIFWVLIILMIGLFLLYNILGVGKKLEIKQTELHESKNQFKAYLDKYRNEKEKNNGLLREVEQLKADREAQAEKLIEVMNENNRLKFMLREKDKRIDDIIAICGNGEADGSF